MRKVVAASAFVAVAVSVSMVACNRAADGPSASTSADVERDLNLASTVHSQRTAVVSPIEQMSNGAPSGNQAGKRVGVPTRKRAPSPAPSLALADVTTPPPDVKEASAPTTVAAVVTEVASAGTGGAPVEEPVFLVSDPIRSTTLAQLPVDASYHADPGAAGYNPHRPGLGVVRKIWALYTAHPGAIIRGTSTAFDHCEPPKIGGGGILGPTFGGAGGRSAPFGTTAGGVGVRTPDNLPPGMDPSRGTTSVAAGVKNASLGRP